MKKNIYRLLVISTIAGAMLVGCGHSHTFSEATCMSPATCSECGATQGGLSDHVYNEATCTTPKTCTICGATIGEAVGHDYLDATCTEPATCRFCGETSGEALGHDPQNANYQAAGVCSICNEVVGDPLVPEFEEHNLSCSATLDTDIPYQTHCYFDTERITTGTVRFSDYKTFKSDETHPAVDGYIWQQVTMTNLFFDDNAAEYGYMLSPVFEDYYGTRAHDRSVKAVSVEGFPTDMEDAFAYNQSTVNFNGQDYDKCILIASAKRNGWEGNNAYFELEISILMPEGYDGFVVGVYDKKEVEPPLMSQFIYDLADDKSIFFRFPAA